MPRYQWNLKEYLPPALQEEMVLLLTEFIYLPWKEAQAAEQQGASQAAGSQAVAVAHTAEDVQTHQVVEEQDAYQAVGLQAAATVHADKGAVYTEAGHPSGSESAGSRHGATDRDAQGRI
eukprot:1159279-Pelagomonas_calceolata.AAC.28